MMLFERLASIVDTYYVIHNFFHERYSPQRNLCYADFVIHNFFHKINSPQRNWCYAVKIRCLHWCISIFLDDNIYKRTPICIADYL